MLCLVQPLCAKAPKDKTKPATIRFMDFNIADGMWWDQFNNYDRFVQWMQKTATASNCPMPLGCGPHVTRAAQHFVATHGRERLPDVAKLHFKVTQKLQ